MEVISRGHVKAIDDVCGKIQELFHSANLSVAYITLTGKATSHMHKNTEEVYYIIKGRGRMKIGDESREVNKDDVIPVPKDVYHSIEKLSDEPLEVLVVTHPRFNPGDVIEAPG